MKFVPHLTDDERAKLIDILAAMRATPAMRCMYCAKAVWPRRATRTRRIEFRTPRPHDAVSLGRLNDRVISFWYTRMGLAIS